MPELTKPYQDSTTEHCQDSSAGAIGTIGTMASSTRYLYATGGCVCVALGSIGIVVPGLPTTVFLLAASYLFARSSPRLHRRLLQDRWLGPYLARMANERAMPRQAKLTALLMMGSGISISCWMLRDLPALQLLTVALGLIGSAVVLFYVPTATPHTQPGA